MPDSVLLGSDEVVISTEELKHIETELREVDEALAETLALVGRQEAAIAKWQNVALFLAQVLAAIYRYQGSDSGITSTLAAAGLVEYQNLVEGESSNES